MGDSQSGRTAGESRESVECQAASTSRQATGRRRFLSLGCTAAMTGGLAAGYGTLATMAVRYLYRDQSQVGWQYVATLAQLPAGQALEYTAPSGAKVVVTRHGAGQSADDFVALSSVCPHLGCQVHWEPQNDRFFCPCHNGAFDRAGNPIQGPPKTAGQPLTRFPVKVDAGLVYVEVPLHHLGDGEVVRAEQRLKLRAPLAQRRANPSDDSTDAEV